MVATGLNRRKLTCDEVLRMVETGILRENEPVELIDGALIIVSPQGPPHATALQICGAVLRSVYSEGFDVRSQLPLQATVTDLPEPDLAVVRGKPRDYARRHPTGFDALLVVEIAQSSQADDRAKAGVYARAAVPVYWILDLPARRLEVRTEPNAPSGDYEVTMILAEAQEVALPESDRTLRIGDLLPE